MINARNPLHSMPPRPALESDDVWHRAATEMWRRVKDWISVDLDKNAPPNDTATLMGEFVAALHQSDLDVENAYQVAYALHTEYDWEPDAELVATLDGWSDVLAAAHEQVVREWVTAHNVLLTRQVGDRVIVRFGGPVAISIERPAIGGEIRALHHDTAEYTVVLDGPPVGGPPVAGPPVTGPNNGEAGPRYRAVFEQVTGDPPPRTAA